MDENQWSLAHPWATCSNNSKRCCRMKQQQRSCKVYPTVMSHIYMPDQSSLEHGHWLKSSTCSSIIILQPAASTNNSNLRPKETQYNVLEMNNYDASDAPVQFLPGYPIFHSTSSTARHTNLVLVESFLCRLHRTRANRRDRIVLYDRVLPHEVEHLGRNGTVDLWNLL